MTVAIRKARQRARKAENGEKEIRFYASPKAQEWAKQEFPNLSVHEAAKWVFEAARMTAEQGRKEYGWWVGGPTIGFEYQPPTIKEDGK